jgi:hypothetical protein
VKTNCRQIKTRRANSNDTEQIQADTIPLTRNIHPAGRVIFAATSRRIIIASPFSPTAEIFNDIRGVAIAYAIVRKVLAHSCAVTGGCARLREYLHKRSHLARVNFSAILPLTGHVGHTQKCSCFPTLAQGRSSSRSLLCRANSHRTRIPNAQYHCSQMSLLWRGSYWSR